jgi:hypothetical protein
LITQSHGGTRFGLGLEATQDRKQPRDELALAARLLKARHDRVLDDLSQQQWDMPADCFEMSFAWLPGSSPAEQARSASGSTLQRQHCGVPSSRRTSLYK